MVIRTAGFVSGNLNRTSAIFSHYNETMPEGLVYFWWNAADTSLYSNLTTFWYMTRRSRDSNPDYRNLRWVLIQPKYVCILCNVSAVDSERKTNKGPLYASNVETKITKMLLWAPHYTHPARSLRAVCNQGWSQRKFRLDASNVQWIRNETMYSLLNIKLYTISMFHRQWTPNVSGWIYWLSAS